MIDDSMQEAQCTTFKGSEIPESWQRKRSLAGLQFYPFVKKDGSVDESKTEVMTLHRNAKGFADTAFYVLPHEYGTVHALNILGVNPLDIPQWEYMKTQAVEEIAK